MDKTRPAIPYLLTVLLAADIAAQQRVSTPSAPRYVLDLGQVVQQQFDGSIPSVTDIAQAGEYWTVLLSVRGIERNNPKIWKGVVLSGNGERVHTSLIDSKVDRIAIDRTGLVMVRHLSDSSSDTVFTTLHWDASKAMESKSIPVSDSLPLFSDGSLLLYSPGHGLEQPNERGRAASEKQALPELDPHASVDQHRFVLGLPSNRYLIFGSIAEDIRVYEGSGQLLSQSYADLNAAYQALGKESHRYDPSEHRSRVMWAATGRDGLLYVCLSDLPVAGPARLAVIQPENGALVSVRSFDLPKVASRIDKKWNPQGTMMPTSGAIGEKVVIIDRGPMVMAIYD